MLDLSDTASWRILIIDDDPPTLRLLEMIFTRNHNATIYQAGGGAEGIELYKQEQPNLVLTDALMPDIDGFGVLEAIRAEFGGDLIPVMAITARAMVGDKEEFTAAGFDGYLTKPFLMATLVEEIKKQLLMSGKAI